MRNRRHLHRSFSFVQLRLSFANFFERQRYLLNYNSYWLVYRFPFNLIWKTNVQGLSPTRNCCQSRACTLVALHPTAHPVPTLLGNSCAQVEKWTPIRGRANSTRCRNRVRKSIYSDTPWTDCIPSLEIPRWKRCTATLPDKLVNKVSHFNC